MAGRPRSEDSEDHEPDEREQELIDQLELFELELSEAIAANDGSIGAAALCAKLERQVWGALAQLLRKRGDYIGAGKASQEEVAHGKLFVSLNKSTLADRVSVLERALAEGRSKGRGIADAARSRKKQ